MALHHPVVCYKIRGRGIFQERFELGEFPMDAQDLQVDIISMRPLKMIGDREVADLKLVKNVNPAYSPVIPNKDFLLSDEYEMCNALGARQGKTSPETSSSRRRYPRLVLSMKVRRLPRFYLIFMYGNFDIIFDRFSRTSQRHPTPHAPRAMLYLTPHDNRVLISACNPMWQSNVATNLVLQDVSDVPFCGARFSGALVADPRPG